MTKSFYKNTFTVHSAEEIALAQQTTRIYLESPSNRHVDFDTGEITEYFPDICKSKRRKKITLNRREQALIDTYGDSLFFYTLILADYHSSWARYDTIFTKAEKVNALVKRIIQGPFIATMEVSAYTGGHVHIVCLKQTHKLLKAERNINDYMGLMQYFSKSQISYDDKSDNRDIYEVMVGMYLQAKAEARKKGKRLSRRKFSRLKEE